MRQIKKRGEKERIKEKKDWKIKIQIIEIIINKLFAWRKRKHLKTLITETPQMADLNADDSIKPCNQITQVYYFDGGPSDIKVRMEGRHVCCKNIVNEQSIIIFINRDLFEQNIQGTTDYSHWFHGNNNNDSKQQSEEQKGVIEQTIIEKGNIRLTNEQLVDFSTNQQDGCCQRVMFQIHQKQRLQDFIRERVLQNAEQLIREIMSSCENSNEINPQSKTQQSDEQINTTDKVESYLREVNEDSFKNSQKNGEQKESEIVIHQSEEREKSWSASKQYVLEIQNYERNQIALQQQHTKAMIQQLEIIENEWRPKLEQQEQELLKVINERQQEIDNLKGQLEKQIVKNSEEVEELKKTIDSLNPKIKEKEYYYLRQKEILAEKIKQLAESQENLQNQKLLTNKNEEISINLIKMLEQMKEEKKEIQDRLQEAQAVTEAKDVKWKTQWENTLKEHQETNQGYSETIAQLEKQISSHKQENEKYQKIIQDYEGAIAEQQNQINYLEQENSNLKQRLKTIKEQHNQTLKDFNLALEEKSSICINLANKSQQTLQANTNLKEELSNSKSIIVSFEQEAKKLIETIASLQEQLNSSLSIQSSLQEQFKEKDDQISYLHETINNQQLQWQKYMNDITSQKDQEVQFIKDKAKQESQLAAVAHAKDLLI